MYTPINSLISVDQTDQLYSYVVTIGLPRVLWLYVVPLRFPSFPPVSRRVSSFLVSSVVSPVSPRVSGYVFGIVDTPVRPVLFLCLFSFSRSVVLAPLPCSRVLCL